LSSKELLKILFSHRWFIIRQRGSHAILRHPEKQFQLVIPIHTSKEMGKGLVKAILKRANIKTKKR